MANAPDDDPKPAAPPGGFGRASASVKGSVEPPTAPPKRPKLPARLAFAAASLLLVAWRSPVIADGFRPCATGQANTLFTASCMLVAALFGICTALSLRPSAFRAWAEARASFVGNVSFWLGILGLVAVAFSIASDLPMRRCKPLDL